MEARAPKILLDEVFTFGVNAACWEVDDRGGEVKSVGHLCNVFLNNSNPFPIRLWRGIKEQTEGKITFENLTSEEIKLCIFNNIELESEL